MLTDPFAGAKDNSVSPANEAYVQEQIYRNDHLRACAAAMKFRFMNAPQALIHGDLHFGSVFVRAHAPVIFDSEFCFFGPIGFDLGNALAHFVMEFLYVQLARPQDTAFLAWLEEMAHELLRTFEARFLSLIGSECTDRVLCSPAFAASFVASVFSDTAGFAGAECLRRTVGIAKIPEFDLLAPAQRATFEQKVMNTGVRLMDAAQRLNSAQALEAFLGKHIF